MKHYFLIFSLSLCLHLHGRLPAGSVADTPSLPQRTAANRPKISFEADTCDFGTFPPDSLQQAVFRFRNDGGAPLIIRRASSDCGCTVPTFPRDSIMPGHWGEVKVRFDGKGRPPGTFMKTVRIRSNAANDPARLCIKGIIR